MSRVSGTSCLVPADGQASPTAEPGRPGRPRQSIYQRRCRFAVSVRHVGVCILATGPPEPLVKYQKRRACVSTRAQPVAGDGLNAARETLTSIFRPSEQDSEQAPAGSAGFSWTPGLSPPAPSSPLSVFGCSVPTCSCLPARPGRCLLPGRRLSGLPTRWQC